MPVFGVVFTRSSPVRGETGIGVATTTTSFLEAGRTSTLVQWWQVTEGWGWKSPSLLCLPLYQDKSHHQGCHLYIYI